MSNESKLTGDLVALAAEQVHLAAETNKLLLGSEGNPGLLDRVAELERKMAKLLDFIDLGE